VSEYSLQLAEKQKLRSIYGVLERQFRRHFEEAERRPGMTGANLLSILERRLDNVVYRLGFGDSRSQARQLVRHGHFRLNGRKTDIPSALVREGDTVVVSPVSRDNEYFAAVRGVLTEKTLPRWLTLDLESLTARVDRAPLREDIDTAVNEQLVVEYYSR
jgi:small subunit ribosomal protein S4